MLSVSNLSVQFGKRVLFDEVNIVFSEGNCYGVIGANGAGKSTFLKMLALKADPTSGKVILEPGKRMSVLEQNHNAYDQDTVLNAVLKGNQVLFAIRLFAVYIRVLAHNRVHGILFEPSSFMLCKFGIGRDSFRNYFFDHPYSGMRLLIAIVEVITGSCNSYNCCDCQ